MRLFKFIWCMLFGHKYDIVTQRVAWMQLDGVEIRSCERCGLVVTREGK